MAPDQAELGGATREIVDCLQQKLQEMTARALAAESAVAAATAATAEAQAKTQAKTQADEAVVVEQMLGSPAQEMLLAAEVSALRHTVDCAQSQVRAAAEQALVAETVVETVAELAAAVVTAEMQAPQTQLRRGPPSRYRRRRRQ